MALSVHSEKIEDLARALVDRTGSNMTDAIEEALQARLAGMGSLLDLDTRPAGELLGYGADGMFCNGH